MNKSISALLPFWDPDSTPEYPFIFVLAARRAGKSTLVRDLVLNYWADEYDFIIGLMGNSHTAMNYIRNGCIPEAYCHRQYNGAILEKWFKKSDKLMKKGNQLPKTLFICDDILSLSKIKNCYTTRNDPWLSKLATCGRHYRASCVLCVQSANIALQYARNADIILVSPSSLFCGQDFEALAKLYMSGDVWKENKTLLKLFRKFDFLVLQYHLATREKELLAYYRVNQQTLSYVKSN